MKMADNLLIDWYRFVRDLSNALAPTLLQDSLHFSAHKGHIDELMRNVPMYCKH